MRSASVSPGGLRILGVPLGHFVGVGGGIFVQFDIRLGEAADRVLVGLQERAVGAEHAAGMPFVIASLGIGDMAQIVLLLDRPGPRVDVHSRVCLSARNRLADQIERHDLPGHVVLGIDAGLEDRNLEHRLRRSAHDVSGDRLTLEILEVLNP